jgi:hypothetical protein
MTLHSLAVSHREVFMLYASSPWSHEVIYRHLLEAT